jgi:uncharacterized membrane-anchored protein
MKYRVVFRERNNGAGEPSDDPPSFVDAELDDETVLDAVFITRNDPEANHTADGLEEDDSFLSLGTEIWEYDVAEGKDQDFKDALLNSGMVVEFEVLGDSDDVGVSA